jgi:formate dehydrogenase iron-sulfur subunit
MADIAMLLDPSRCTGCRGCQVACKLWNKRSFVKTENTGSYENPPRLSKNNYRRIAFIEQGEGASMKWLFRQEQCFHCANAACVTACPTGALSYKEKGIVLLEQEKCIGCRYCESVCPFQVPQYDAATKKSFKCTFCIDRIQNGMGPSCAKACPTNAIEFSWNRDELVAKAKARAEKTGMRLYGADNAELGLHVMHLLPESAAAYRLPEKPSISAAVIAWKNVFKPLVKWGIGLGLAAAALHYITLGPNEIGADAKEKGGEG